jgi:hypothetical protein
MPRLSLYRPEKAHDYKFFDRTILEQFMVGGTDVYIHKYLGPKSPDPENATPDQPVQNGNIPELGIQDLLLLENRDRQYSEDVYVMRCIYNLQQLDWSLSQFGLFLANDTIFVHFHLNDTVKQIGRKLMSGDVIELPHLKDPYALNDASVAMRRFYVVDDVLRATEGFSATWYPHLIKVKCKPLVNSQEYADIMNRSAEDPASPYAPTGDDRSLLELMNSYNSMTDINNAIIAQAEEDAPMSGYDTDHLWMIPVDEFGKIMLADDTMDGTSLYDASDFYVKVNGVFTKENGDPITDPNGMNVDQPTRTNLEVYGVPVIDTSITLKSPRQNYYLSYIGGSFVPPNGYRLHGMGAQFPDNCVQGNFFLRTDFMPNRLFRFDGRKWVKFIDQLRMTMTNTNSRLNQKTSFINNTNKTVLGDKELIERQSLSKAKDFAKQLKPIADNP